MKTFKTTQSDLLKYNGLKCKVLELLNESEYDREDVGDMFNIELENGVKLQAFLDEIKEG